ncbi:MAG: hypothetical protein Q9219_005343 [cf. Caloplaca sp. 3 TL-2023]
MLSVTIPRKVAKWIALLLLVANACRAAPELVGCFDQIPPFPAPIPTVFKHCHDTIKYKMMLDSKLAMLPQHFSRTEGRGVTVPAYWQTGQCLIKIDMHTETDEDTLRFFDISVQASMINIYCVARPPHWGGTSLVGPKEVMNVTLYGVRDSHSPQLEALGSTHNVFAAEN